jgi:hypothetical protein
MHSDGFCIAAVARDLGVTKIHVQHFLSGRYDKMGRKTRRRIWEYFVEHGWLKRPNRKPPVCKVCGTEYPTRVHRHPAAEGVDR